MHITSRAHGLSETLYVYCMQLTVLVVTLTSILVGVKSYHNSLILEEKLSEKELGLCSQFSHKIIEGYGLSSVIWHVTLP